VGTVSALLTGASIPSFNILFGRMLDKINGDQSKFDETINLTAIILAAVGGLALLVGTLQVYCWTAVGERLTQRMREMYVTAILRQEIGWFDKIGATELSPKVADLCGKVIHRVAVLMPM
jgi:ATP-binding cassette subfamily B (MDR/TAP) protein 1